MSLEKNSTNNYLPVENFFKADGLWWKISKLSEREKKDFTVEISGSDTLYFLNNVGKLSKTKIESYNDKLDGLSFSDLRLTLSSEKDDVDNVYKLKAKIFNKKEGDLLTELNYIEFRQLIKDFNIKKLGVILDEQTIDNKKETLDQDQNQKLEEKKEVDTEEIKKTAEENTEKEKPTEEKTEYLSREEIYNYWGENPARLKMVLAFLNANEGKNNLEELVSKEYGIDLNKFLIKKDGYYRQPENIDRFKSFVLFVLNLLEENEKELNVQNKKVFSTTISESKTKKEDKQEAVVNETEDPGLLSRVRSALLAVIGNTKRFGDSLKKTIEVSTASQNIVEEKELLKLDARELSLAIQTGFTATQIGDIYGKSRNAVLGLVYRYGGRDKIVAGFKFTLKEKSEYEHKYLSYKNKRIIEKSEKRRAVVESKKIEKHHKEEVVDPKIKTELEEFRKKQEAQKKRKENSKEGFAEVLKNRAESILEEGEYADRLEIKLAYLMLLLKGDKKIDISSKYFHGISIRELKTLKVSPATTTEVRMMPTKVIEIEVLNKSIIGEDDYNLQLAFWYSLVKELKKIHEGKSSILARFLILDRDKYPTNRLGVELRLRLSHKEALEMDLIRQSEYLNIIYCPDQTGNEFVVNYDNSQEEEHDRKMTGIINGLVVVKSEKQPKEERRSGRYSELSEFEKNRVYEKDKEKDEERKRKQRLKWNIDRLSNGEVKNKLKPEIISLGFRSGFTPMEISKIYGVDLDFLLEKVNNAGGKSELERKYKFSQSDIDLFKTEFESFKEQE